MTDSTILIKNAIILNPGENDCLKTTSSVLIKDDIIAEIGDNITEKADKVIDGEGKILMPGLIKTLILIFQ